MNIDWTHFTPQAALTGGALIGLATGLLLVLNGRIAGISGILGGLLQRCSVSELSWRAAFVAGLVVAPALFGLFLPLPEIRVDARWGGLVVAGLLVGYGARLGSGCTSGHGVCGLSRMSPRSLVATLTFMGTGFMTVFVVRHLLA
ncbi:MAG TPA: YeeE/YedE family protein [Zoogloea sp.]|uniref:YeeE/YedE family protein n=1 Tax=Zoogloea sp. TaxID=49181 RepID=UPI002C775FA6|nr:YeeE/YedE family protein [Zoogloea sp.]HMV62202.1 YeeE/YedE family protein [Rhodocyclaceae bacterium]HMY49961.1 YeeE/YedE family protein [Rhodocyclaceae bacterium]HMZ76152.1 YeeE/YedE family protein [Rhodocyclaceae bacterium]HNA67179.1 YeeE/YedE family protein [Rhodocyclaceae bacterium]HNB65628.1 YeeE/YedE family protein [Rhodocyclaceae bacterium]